MVRFIGIISKDFLQMLSVSLTTNQVSQLHSAVEEVQCSLPQVQRKCQCPEILCLWPSISSSVQSMPKLSPAQSLSPYS